MEKTVRIIAKITLVFCLLCTLSFAEKPKVAVYVSETSGYSNTEKSALRTATMNVIVRSGKYEVVERSSVIDKELSRQASGAVDDDQMVVFGRQAGARYVCVSDIISLGSYRVDAVRNKNGQVLQNAYTVHPHQVSARIIDVETAQLVGLGVIDQDINDGQAMSAAITKAVEKMMGTISDRTNPELPKKAVYVEEGQEGRRRNNNKIANALYTYTLEAVFTRSRYNGDFVVVERSEAFTRQIDREHGKQRSGSVDNNEISRMGKQYGISEICIANIEPVMGTYNINARLVNVERASVVDASKLRHLSEKERLEANSSNKLRNIAVQMVEDMIPRQISEAEQEADRQREAEIEEISRNAWIAGFGIGGGVSFDMTEIDPKYYTSLGGQFTMNAEFYKQNLKFIRFGINMDLGGVGTNRNTVREERPNVITDSISSFNARFNAFVKLYPANFLFLSGGAGWAYYRTSSKENSSLNNVDLVKFSTVIFPVGGGIILGPGGGNGIYIEGLYNIVPFQGRTATYMSINAGIKYNIRITEEKKYVRQMI